MDSISWTIIDKMFKENTNFLTKHHLDSYNNFFDNGIKEVFKNQNPMKFYRTKDNKHNVFKHISLPGNSKHLGAPHGAVRTTIVC